MWKKISLGLAIALSLYGSALSQGISPEVGPGPVPCGYTQCVVTGINATTLGSITAVAYGFNSAKTGWYSGTQDASVGLSVNGAVLFDYAITNAASFTFGNTINMAAHSIVAVNNLSASNASAFSFQNSAASATNPTLLPNRASQTGIGAQATGNMSEIVQGVEMGRWTTTGLNGAIIGATTPAAGSFTYNAGTGDFVCAPVTSGALSQGVTTCVASDKRVKNDLGVITPEKAVARIMALPDEHRFTYKPGYGPPGDHTGWWAQDIQKVWPGVVYKGKKMPITPDGELTFDRGEIGPDTTTAVKFLVAQVATLKTENIRLRAANDNFNRRLMALEHPRLRKTALK